MRVAAILTSLLFVVGPAVADQNAQPWRNHQFTILKGMIVENTDGERLGTLNDLTLDAHSGRVEFAIIKSGGFGSLSKLRIVPAFCLSLSSVKRQTLSLDVTDTRWGGAPVFKRKHLKDLGNPASQKEIASFYHFVDDIPQAEKVASIHSLTPTGPAGARAQQTSEKMILASELVGREVLNEKHQCLGKSCDLLVDTTSAKQTFIVFSAGTFLKRQSPFAVPLTSTQETEKVKLIVRLHQPDLAAAPAFDWTNARLAAVYRMK